MSANDSVTDALRRVQERIERACAAAGRDPATVSLLAVSKTQPAERVREAYRAGQRRFGENYVQELVQKAAELADLPDLEWHLIGHLQRNKARHVVRVARVVQSVDSLELARELDRRHAAQRTEDGHRLRVLVEVSIAGEAQKHGVSLDELPALLEGVEALPGLELRGLMCVPPLGEAPEAARPFFEKLAALRDRLGGAARLPELSMGMTSDLEPAIAAGATMVRVGTAIFGARPAPPG